MKGKAAPIPPSLLRHPAHLVSLGFGSGLSPVAPGTIGSLAALPLAALAHQAGVWPYVAICVALTAVAIGCAALTALLSSQRPAH